MMPEPQQEQHCGHECVCDTYRTGMMALGCCGFPKPSCANNGGVCPYDTRSRPLTKAPDPEQQQISDIIKDLERSLLFYQNRVNMLQCWQSSMRDPERKIVCDILANGFTLTTKEEIKVPETEDALTAAYLKGKADGRAENIRASSTLPYRIEKDGLHVIAPEGFVSIEDPNCPLYQAVRDAQVAHAATLAENKRVLDELTEGIKRRFDNIFGYGLSEGEILEVIGPLRIQEAPK
jgi:hypothetical protein